MARGTFETPCRMGPGMRKWAAVVTDLLALWILAAVAAGLLWPGLAVLEPLVVPLLALMVGSVSLTLSLQSFRRIQVSTLLRTLAVHAAMGGAAFLVARSLGLSPELTLGFVILGAVPPELTAPLMTRLAGGATALAVTVLLVAGAASLATVPAYGSWLGGGLRLDLSPLLSTLAVAVVLPMAVAVAVRHRWPRAIGRGDHVYPAVSALAVIAVMAIVAAGSRDAVTTDTGRLALVAAGVFLLHAVGYAAGWAVCLDRPRTDRIAAAFSVGMRDFAVAAALVTAAGLPPQTALPAVLFGFLEMILDPLVARRLARGPPPPQA